MSCEESKQKKTKKKKKSDPHPVNDTVALHYTDMIQGSTEDLFTAEDDTLLLKYFW